MAKTLDLLKIPRNEVVKFINSLENVLVDCDGVLWTDAVPIPGVSDVLNQLQNKMNKRVIYVTNNCVRTRDEIVSKAKSLNFIVKNNNLINTSYLTAQYLKKSGFVKKVYVLGSPGLVKELKKACIQCVDPEDILYGSILDYNKNTKLDLRVGAVVVGMDYSFNFSKLLKASSYLQRRNCLLIATSPDERCANARGLIVPATGSIARAIESCSGVNAQVIGKPSQVMIDYLTAEYKMDPKKTVMVGDNYKTDILFGKRASYKTILVLTGVTKEDDIEKLGDDYLPDFYLDSLASLKQFLK